MMGKVLYKLDLLEVDFPLRCDLLFEDVGLFFFFYVDHQSIQSNCIFSLSLLTCCV